MMKEKEMSDDLVGKKAPSFTLPSSDQKLISLKDFRGKLTVLYFYPKDETSGCTLEALAFKERYWEFNDLDAAVLGISPDDIKSHCKFSRHHDLSFPLLSDIEHAVSKSYGVWVQKTMYGKTYWGVERTTFVIDKNGKIKEILKNKKPDEHASLALEIIKN